MEEVVSPLRGETGGGDRAKWWGIASTGNPDRCVYHLLSRRFAPTAPPSRRSRARLPAKVPIA